jgi:hypothetical protein
LFVQLISLTSGESFGKSLILLLAITLKSYSAKANLLKLISNTKSSSTKERNTSFKNSIVKPFRSVMNPSYILQ